MTKLIDQLNLDDDGRRMLQLYCWRQAAINFEAVQRYREAAECWEEAGEVERAWALLLGQEDSAMAARLLWKRQRYREALDCYQRWLARVEPADVTAAVQANLGIAACCNRLDDAADQQQVHYRQARAALDAADFPPRARGECWRAVGEYGSRVDRWDLIHLRYEQTLRHYAGDRRTLPELLREYLAAVPGNRTLEERLQEQLAEYETPGRRPKPQGEELRAAAEQIREVRRFERHTSRIDSVSFSSDGRLLASGSEDNTVRLWNPDTGHELRCLRGHQDRVWSVSFSSDGRLLASGSSDKTVRLWNPDTGQELRCLQGHQGSVSSVSFSADGRLLASGSEDRTVRLWNPDTGQGDLVRVRPPDPQARVLSGLYDRIADAVRLYEAELYVGEELAFVRYRDREAPFGYDLSGKPPRKSKRLRLLGFGQPIELATRQLKTITLRDVVLDAAPAVSRRPAEAADRIFVLCATELEKTFRRYFRSHHLSYRLIRIPCGHQQTGTLFEVEPVAAAATVPAFAIAYLRSFPRSVVFNESFQTDHRRVLVEIGCTVAWNWPNTVSVFPEDCLLTLTNDRDFANLCLDPAPSLIDGDTLIQVAAKEIAALQSAPLAKPTLEACRFEIRFQRDNGPAVAPAALLLGERELIWLRRLLYRLLASEFSQYAVLPASPYSVLLSDQTPLQDLPLGVAMKRVADSGLLIPCHLKLLPELPLRLLADALNVKAGKLTFITEDFRCEAELTDFVPLSSLLHSPLNREPIELVLQPTNRLPDLKWKMPKGFLEEPAPPAAGSPAASGRAPKSAGKRPSSVPADAVEMDLIVKSKAASLRSADDPLGAALYYALAGDLSVTAELFRHQAAGLRGGEPAAGGTYDDRR